MTPEPWPRRPNAEIARRARSRISPSFPSLIACRTASRSSSRPRRSDPSWRCPSPIPCWSASDSAARKKKRSNRSSKTRRSSWDFATVDASASRKSAGSVHGTVSSAPNASRISEVPIATPSLRSSSQNATSLGASPCGKSAVGGRSSVGGGIDRLLTTDDGPVSHELTVCRLAVEDVAVGRLDELDLTKSLTRKEEQAGLVRAWERLSQLRLTLGGQLGERRLGPPVCVLFEGWDASGKGGAIKRLVVQMAPRLTRSDTTSYGASGPGSPGGVEWPSSTAPGTGGCWSRESRNWRAASSGCVPTTRSMASRRRSWTRA